jgi:SOS response regulatory protein OraA/RecX
MCNLSQGILEKGEIRGEAKAEAKIILNMYKKGFTVEQIADVTDKKVEEVRAIIEKREPVLA